MSCRPDPPERYMGEVDDELLEYVRAAYHCAPLRVHVSTCIPDTGRMPYMSVTTETCIIGSGWRAFLGFN